MITLLSAPEILSSSALARRFFVELASNELVLDTQGVPVPAATRMLDVCVVEPTREAISTLLQVTGHLHGWSIVRHWPPEDECPF